MSKQGVGMDSSEKNIKQRIRLKPMKEQGKRECYATAMLLDFNGKEVEIVVGTRTKKLVKELFAHLCPGYEAIEDRVYRVIWSKADG